MGINALPNEVLAEIFFYLNPDERRTLRFGICRHWKSILEENTTIKLCLNEDNILHVVQTSGPMRQIELKINNLTTEIVDAVSGFLNNLRSVEMNGNINSRNLVKLMTLGHHIKILKIIGNETKIHDLNYLKQQLDTMELENPRRAFFPNLETLVINTAMPNLNYVARILELSSVKHVRIIGDGRFTYKDPFQKYEKSNRCQIYKILHSNKTSLKTLSFKATPNVFGTSEILIKFYAYDRNQTKQRIHSFMSTGDHPQLGFWLDQLKMQTEIKVLRFARLIRSTSKTRILEVANKNFATLESLYIQSYLYTQRIQERTLTQGIETWDGTDFLQLKSLKQLSLHYFPQVQVTRSSPKFTGIKMLPPSLKTLSLSFPIKCEGIPGLTQLQPIGNLQGLEILELECPPWFSYDGDAAPGNTLSQDELTHLQTIFPNLRAYHFSGVQTVRV